MGLGRFVRGGASDLAGPPRAEGIGARAPLAIALTVLVLLAVWTSSASAAAPVYLYQGFSFGPDGTESSEFQRPGPIAVDTQSGSIYVGDTETGTLQKFNEDYEPEDFSALGSNEIPVSFLGPGESQIAVNSSTHVIYVTSGNSIVAYQANGEPSEFSATGSEELIGFSEVCGVAVDPNGDIYAGDYAAGEIHVFSPQGDPLTSFKSEFICNLAVDSQGNVTPATTRP